MAETAADSAGGDSALVTRCGRGDDDAVRELYEKHSDGVFRFLLRRLNGNIQDAEDLTLETFAAAVRLSKSYAARSTVFVWLCGIARVRLIDFHRQRSRLKRASVFGDISLSEANSAHTHDGLRTGATVDEVVSRLSAREMVDAALATLSTDEREAIVLHYVEEFSLRDVARHMKRTEKAIKSLLTRAKSKMRALLGGQIGNPGESND